MVKTVNLSADITAKRDLHITLPADVPLGPAEIVVVVSPAATATPSTLGRLLISEFCGMWRDRTDIGDSSEFAGDLRSHGWQCSA